MLYLRYFSKRTYQMYLVIRNTFSASEAHTLTHVLLHWTHSVKKKTSKNRNIFSSGLWRKFPLKSFLLMKIISFLETQTNLCILCWVFELNSCLHGVHLFPNLSVKNLWFQQFHTIEAFFFALKVFASPTEKISQFYTEFYRKLRFKCFITLISLPILNFHMNKQQQIYSFQGNCKIDAQF